MMHGAYNAKLIYPLSKYGRFFMIHSVHVKKYAPI